MIIDFRLEIFKVEGKRYIICSNHEILFMLFRPLVLYLKRFHIGRKQFFPTVVFVDFSMAGRYSHWIKHPDSPKHESEKGAAPDGDTVTVMNPHLKMTFSLMIHLSRS